jgi:hypothetical protein
LPFQRRDPKKTQKAAIFAKMYPEPAQLKRKGVVAGASILPTNMNGWRQPRMLRR